MLFDELRALDPFCNAQFCAARTWINPLFVFPGLHWLRRDQPQAQVWVWLWFRPFRPIEKSSAAVTEEIFYDAIFERMKANDRDPGARLETVGQNLEAFSKSIKLIINFHP